MQRVETDTKAEELRTMLGGIEMQVMTNYTLADAIREGSMVTEQADGWGCGTEACALHAAVIAARARNFI